MITSEKKADMAVKWLLWENPRYNESYFISKIRQLDGSYKFALITEGSCAIGKKDFALTPQPLPSNRDEHFYVEFRYDTWEEAYIRWEEFHTMFPDGVYTTSAYADYLEALVSGAN